MSDQDLLSALRLDPADRDDGHAGWSRALWIGGGALLVLLLLVAGAVWWMTRAAEVELATAMAPTASRSEAVLQASGYVTARRAATVSAQIVGALTEVLIEEGDAVQQGQVLARLDDSAQQAALNSARAGAAQARAQWSNLEVRQDQARRELRRLEELVERQLASSQALEQAGTEVESLDAQLLAAQAALQVAEAQVAMAQVNFDHTVVRAPFDGVVTQKAAQVGEIIAPSAAGGGFTRTGVGTIVDMNSLEVDVDVNEAYIGRVAPNMPAEAVLDAYPDWIIPARVIAIVPTADRGKATVKVRVALEERDARIVPDMGVRVSFLEQRAPAEEPPAGVLVPSSAVVQRDGQAVVFVAEGGVARQLRVEPAESTGSLRRIPAGLAPGSSVVRRPPASLADGDRIRSAQGRQRGPSDR